MEKPTTPGDWMYDVLSEGKWDNYMGMIEEGSNRVPSADGPFNNEGERTGALIHQKVACRLLGKDNLLTSMDDLVSASFYVDNLMEKFVDKYVDEVLGVEAVIKDPRDDKM